MNEVMLVNAKSMKKYVVCLWFSVLFFAVGVSSLGYSAVSIYRRSIAGQGELYYSGDVDFVSIDFVNVSAVNVTLNVKIAKTYDVVMVVNFGYPIEKYESLGNVWDVGVYSVVFNGVSLAISHPFLVQVVVEDA